MSGRLAVTPPGIQALLGALFDPDATEADRAAAWERHGAELR